MEATHGALLFHTCPLFETIPENIMNMLRKLPRVSNEKVFNIPVIKKRERNAPGYKPENH